MKKGKKESTR